VGSWSQLKQNVPGFGVGTALKYFEEINGIKVQDLYDDSCSLKPARKQYDVIG
jgi:phosphoenolpyruvate carboxylase